MPSPIEQLERSLKVYKGLVEVSALINAITDFDELLAAILDVARRVMIAEASSLFLEHESGNLRLVIARGAGGEVEGAHVVIPRGRGIAGTVFETGDSLLVPDAYADPRFYPEVDKKSGFKTRSILCVPLVRDAKKIGVLQVLNPVGKNAFDETDLEAFEAYSHLAATAIDKLRAIERQREQERVAQELALAHEIQTSFLPQSLPTVPGLTFAATYRPARNVSGDFYDVLDLGPDEIYFVIGDVSGKGVPAALLMAQSLSTLRLIVKQGIPPVAALKRWNEMLCGHTIRGMFITTILGRIVPSQRTVEFASAGHCPPFRVAGAQAHDVPTKGAPPIGILEHLEYHSNLLTLAPGEWLVFFTDGLTESFNPSDVLLDREGVQALLAHDFSSASSVTSALQRGEAEHRQDAEPSDDLTVLVFGFR